MSIHSLIILLALFSSTAFATDNSRGIAATGTCVRKISQDRAAVSFTTVSLQANPGKAIQEATREHESLRAALKKLNLADAIFDTESVQVREDREWVGKKMVSRGYMARISIRVETSDISKIGEAIAVAGKQGVKEIGDLSTFVSRGKHKQEYEECLETATRNAKDKAQKLAKGAGVKLGKVLQISESGNGGYDGYSMIRGNMVRGLAAPDAEAAMQAPTVDVKPTEITVSATVVFGVD